MKLDAALIQQPEKRTNRHSTSPCQRQNRQKQVDFTAPYSLPVNSHRRTEKTPTNIAKLQDNIWLKTINRQAGSRISRQRYEKQRTVLKQFRRNYQCCLQELSMKVAAVSCRNQLEAISGDAFMFQGGVRQSEEVVGRRKETLAEFSYGIDKEYHEETNQKSHQPGFTAFTRKLTGRMPNSIKWFDAIGIQRRWELRKWGRLPSSQGRPARLDLYAAKGQRERG